MSLPHGDLMLKFLDLRDSIEEHRLLVQELLRENQELREENLKLKDDVQLYRTQAIMRTATSDEDLDSYGS